MPEDQSAHPHDQARSLYYPDRATIGGFNSGKYWSSSQSDSTTAWYQQFNNALEFKNGGKYATIGVRPVRAF